jgi:pyridoxal phosphate enzyme (YggS family)
VSAGTATLRENVARVRDTIADVAARAGRRPEDVTLVAVSKTLGPERVAEAAAEGLRVFGENRVQEAADKIPAVERLVGAPLEWHLIGTLQRNKVKAALSLFAVLQSVDSPRLAETISARVRGNPAPVLLEVYFGDDPARPGFRPADLADQLPRLIELPGLRILGLMTVAPFGWDRDATRGVFARLRELRNTLASSAPGLELRELSMGMTDDYPLAIAEGATIVRVGRAIFGERPSHFTG